MLVFLLTSLILTGRRRWLGAGACAALATLTWQPALLVAVVAVAAAALTAGPGRARALLRFVVGGTIPTVVTALYFVQAGAARQAFDGFFVVNLRYTTQPSIFDHRVLGQLWHDYHSSLLLVVAGLLSLLVLAGRAVPSVVLPAEAPSTVAWRLTVVGAGGLAAVVWTVCVVNGGPDLFVVLPFAALGAAGGLAALLSRLPLRAAVARGRAARRRGRRGREPRGRDHAQGHPAASARRRPGRARHPAGRRDDPVDRRAAGPRRRPTAPPRRYQLFDERMNDFIDATQPEGTAGLAARLAR